MTITPESVTALLSSESLGDRIRGVNQLRELDKSIAYELVQASIQDKSTRVRYAAVSLMDTIGDVDLPKSLEILRDCLKDPEYDVKSAAADALGGLKLTAALPEMIDLYHETEEWLLKLSIVASLGAMQDQRAFALFAESIESDVELVRMTTVQAIGDMCDPIGVDLLAKVTTEPDTQIRFRVAEALGKIGGEQAQDLLKQMANDSDPQVAEQAKAFL
jgi:HEAT repeat protein